MLAHETSTSEEEGIGGELENVKEMPVDILLEIFGNLDPIDLLHLSRASKRLREILTSSDAIYLWHQSYHNIPRRCPQPPSCPADVNIIFYTKFLYETHCQFCGSDNNIFHHFHALVRFCLNCVKAGFLMEFNSGDYSQYQIIELCHAQRFRRLRRHHLIVKFEYDRRRREWAAAIRQNKLTEYTHQRITIVVHREQHSRQLRLWKDRFESWRLKKLLVERRRNIRRKLRIEGYREEVDKLAIDDLPHVNETKPLTNFEWKHIRADIIDGLFDLSEELEVRKLRSSILASLEWMHDIIHDQLEVHRCAIPPTVLHIALSQPFLAYFKQDIRTGSTFESQLRKFVTTWRQDMDEYLASLLPNQSSDKRATDPKRLLERATTFFNCPNCSEPISYPRILMHDCTIQVPTVVVPDNVQEVTALAQSGCQPRQPRPRRVINWDSIIPGIMQDHGSGIQVGKTGLGITFNNAACGVACRIVLAFGEDPKTVTFVEMQRRNGRIECLRCDRDASNRMLVMTWTEAILHDLKKHYGEDSPHEAVWRIIRSKVERSYIQLIEGQHSFSGDWQVLVCERVDRFGLNIRAHLEQSIDLSMHRPPYPVRYLL